MKKNNLLSNMGEKIKNRRIELKITQEELSELTGYSDRSSITKIEKGKVDLTLSKLKEFAKVLKVSPEYLMGYKENEKNSNPYFVDTSVLTPEELAEFEKVTGVNKQLFFNDVDDEHDMAVFKRAVIDILIKQRENKK